MSDDEARRMGGWWDNQTAYQLARVESKIDRLTNLISNLLQQSNLIERTEMATQETLDRLTADVTANTNATQAAAQALSGYVATIAELTKKLQDALSASGVDDPTVVAAAAALEANTAALTAAVPTVAAAVEANTK